MSLADKRLEYQKASEAAADAWAHELERRSVLQQSFLFKVILEQHLALESNSSQKEKVSNSTKHELNKVQHEKKLLENKVSQQSNEIENLKKKASTQLIIQKENLQLKNQVSKLNSQVSEFKNETNKNKQQYLTQKAVLESKLENAKKTIKTFKDQKVPISKLNPPKLGSPTKPNPLTKPQVSNFSLSPFLSKASKAPTSPTKQITGTPSVPKRHPLSIVESSTPEQPVNHVLAQSTPGTGMKSPSKVINKRPGSALKNLLSPNKPNETAGAIKKKKKITSLFDEEEAEDDDIFGNAVKKIKVKETKDSEDNNDVGNDTANNTNAVIKRKRKKLGTKTIVEVDEDELHNGNFSPLKKVKLLDKLGGISPLKQRNKERNLFKV